MANHLFDRNFKDILSSQIVSVIGSLLAGTLLALYMDKLFLLPGMLILLPGFLEMRGSISGTFASRLSSGLFLKVINPDKVETRLIRGNVIASFLLAMAVSFALGLVAFLLTLVLLQQSIPQLIIVPLLAGIIANAVEIPLTLFMTLYLFRKGHDPNNIMGPFITSTGDIISILSLLAVMMVIA